jgi:hypothetical protein
MAAAAAAVDAAVDTFGPFVIPATLFAVGLVGYLLLVTLTRLGVLPLRDGRE